MRECWGKLAAAIAWVGLLAGCASQQLAPAAAPAAAPGPIAWVQWGDAGQVEVRAVVEPAGACPVVAIDGQAVPLRQRAAAAALRARGPRHPAARFDATVCEHEVPPGTRTLAIAGRPLPLPASAPRRILVVGDTGCRIAHGALQDCNDPQAWPFARVAATAAALHPELVIHVGDYHYRETACPPGRPGCEGSPWGYGWNTWRADFFEPAAPLLATAPWVFVRGNHEECARAGQGWFRLLAPERFQPRRSCDDPANDDEADYSAPYAVPLGAALQLLVADSAHAGNAPLDPRKPRDATARAHYAAEMRSVARLAARPGVRSWFVSHHPVLGFAPRGGEQPPYGGNPALLQALTAVDGARLFPDGVQFALHGHVHLLEALSFATGEPATLVAGNGGDNLDAQLPHADLAQFSPAPGVRVAQATHANRFGFVLLERPDAAAETWRLTAYRADGSVLTACRLGPARALRCEPTGSL